MENRDKETFRYTYSAKEQTEIQNIRKKYETTTEQEDKMAQLRRLDASVSSKATTVALVVGIVGALIPEIIDPNPEEEIGIQGETFIKVKTSYKYKFNGYESHRWELGSKCPVKIEIDPTDPRNVTITWT